MNVTHPTPRSDADLIAECFVAARLGASALSDFPGAIPDDIESAYRVQAAAIARWPDRIAGWKVGGIALERQEPGGDERLVGPVFARSLREVHAQEIVEFPVFVGGFAAVEAELVFRIGRDAPVSKVDWTTQEALGYATDLYIGIETAGSPLATINELGPRVVVSDFGNNAGLQLGAAIADWRGGVFTPLTCVCRIDGVEVGQGTVAALNDGPAIALAFALSRCARNGRPLRAGDLVTTGAITGIHDIVAGQRAEVEFGRLGSIRCRAVGAHAFHSEIRA